MVVMDSKKMKEAVNTFRADFEKSFGEKTLRIGKAVRPYQVISTGSLTLDLATGVGGYVEGRITEMWGPGDLGKTSLSFLAAVEAQRKYPNRMVAYIDVENKVDEKFADLLGVDRSRWMLYVPRTAEDVSDSLKRFLMEPLFSMVIVDSVGAMIGRIEQEKQADEDTIAVTARIISRMTRHATCFASQNNAVVLIINQPRSMIGGRFNGVTTTPGGWVLKLASTMRFKLSATNKPPLSATIKGERIPVGREVAIKVERNKVAPAGTVANVLLKTVSTERFGPPGVDKVEEAVILGTKLGVIKRTSGHYVLPDGEMLPSQDKLEEYIRHSPRMFERIRNDLIALSADDVIYPDPDDSLVLVGLPDSDGDPELDPPEVESEVDGLTEPTPEAPQPLPKPLEGIAPLSSLVLDPKNASVTETETDSTWTLAPVIHLT
jgi:recombination protein RecA